MKYFFMIIVVLCLSGSLLGQSKGIIFQKIDKNFVNLNSDESSKISKIINKSLNKKSYELVKVTGFDKIEKNSVLKINIEAEEELIFSYVKKYDAICGYETFIFRKNFFSYAILVKSEKSFFAFYQIGPIKYNIEQVNNELFVLTQVDNELAERFGSEDNDCRSSNKNAKTQNQKTTFSSTKILTNPEIKLLVAYTAAAAAPPTDISSIIAAAYGQTCDTYSDSGIDINLSIAYQGQVNISESNSLSTDLTNFEASEEVQILREQYGADICVLLVSNSTDGFAGYAAGDLSMDTNSPYCVVRTDYAVSKITFAHEIGHLQGGHHQWGKDNATTIGHGYYYEDQNPANSWRTIMSVKTTDDGGKYGTSIETRIPFWSNPDNSFLGNILGTSNANNKSRLNSTASQISAIMSDPITLSGSINSNTTLSGKINVTGNVTVANGVTLTISSGTTVYFKSGTTLTVNGTLNANAVVFKSAYTWGGIQFNSGSSGSLNSCTINNVLTYGGAAISINNASPTIQNCTINNNSGVTSGVSLFNSSGTTLTNNNISSSSSYALYFYNSNGYLSGNTITGGSTSTAYCYDHSSPWFSPYGTGNNIIQEGTHGVYAYYYSAPSLSSGNNSIWNNSTYQATAYSGSVIYANSVCWGTQNPVIDWDYGSNIYHLNPLQCSSPKIIESGNKTSRIPIVFVNDDNAAKAHDLRLNAKFTEAVNICKSIISTKRNPIEANSALVELGFIYKVNKDKAIIDFIESIALDIKEATELKATALSTLSNMYYSNHDYDATYETIVTLVKQYPRTFHEKAAKLNLVYLYASMGENDLATTTLENFKKKFADDENILAAEWFIKSHSIRPTDKEQNGSDPNKAFQSEEDIETDELVSNYPNPFNPSTQISFTLKERANISLKVYDVLGKEVANLADGYYEAGKHTATFDGSNLASGIYFYRLTTPTATITKKMMLVK